MRLGLFGGSFDPVHRGHLLLADCCCEQARLDEIWFIPTAHQPLKPAGPRASNTHRLAMLGLLCETDPRYQVSTLELDRGGVSYTVDTLAAIHEQLPSAELFFLMGADSLAELPSWHRPGDICRLATPLVVHREATAAPDFSVIQPLVTEDRYQQIRQHEVEMPPTPISSSLVRDLIAGGGDWQDLVPASVADYIVRNQLYRPER